MRLTAPIMPSCRLAAMVVFMTSSGWPRVVTSNMFIPAPTRRLENLTGFFSSLFGAESTPKADAAVDMVDVGEGEKRWPDRGGWAASLPVVVVCGGLVVTLAWMGGVG